jgi:Zn-dependent protease
VYYRKAAGLAPAPALACARLIYLRRDRLSREDARDIRSLVSRPVTDDGYWTHICSAIYYWALAAREKDGQKLGYARKAALRAQEIRPYEDDAYLFLGLIDVAAGHTARAERVLNEARKVAPLDSGISLLLANISLRQGYWQPAESDLLQAKKGLTLSDRMAGLDKKVEKLLAVSRQAQDLNPLVGIIGAFLILIVSIILHELAHGWTALKSGDPTARNEGRLSLNPLVHIDPFGTVLLPAVLFLVHSAVLIGWAKPVPVNSAYFRRPRRDEARVALAGPAMNLLIGLCCLLGLAAAGLYLTRRGYEAYDFGTLGSPALVVGGDGAVFWAYAVSILKSGVLISGILAGLNLLPIPPLDGSHVLRALLPFRWVDPVFDFLSRWGLLAVVALAFLGGLDYLLLPAFTVTQALTAFVAGTLGLG